MTHALDAIVIGGGIVGASCAYFLAEEGLSVALLERRDLASGTSSACQSNVGVGAGTSHLAPYIQVAVSTHALLRSQGIDEGYSESGGIVFATTEDEARMLRDEVAALSSLGVASEMLDERGALELEPNLRQGLPGLAYEPANGQINPMRTTVHLAVAARRRGAAIIVGREVTAIDVRGGRIHGVVTEGGELTAANVVIAAGAWTRHVGALAGLRLPIWPRKGHIVVTEPRPGWLRHMLFEFGYEATLGQGFSATGASSANQAGLDRPPPSAPEVGTIVQPLPTGQILVGNSREYDGWDLTVRLERVRQIARRAVEFVPGLAKHRVLRTYAGLRPWSADGVPLIGPFAGVPGLWTASGHGGGGITGGPLAGRLIAELISGRPTVIDPAPFRPDRFGDELYRVPAARTDVAG